MDKEIKIRTDLNQRHVQEHLAPLKEDLDNENVFLSIESPEYHGIISELTVFIVGGVSVYLIKKLIDIVVDRIVSGNKANVKIVHIENNVTFILPDQSKDAEEYFKRQERRLSRE